MNRLLYVTLVLCVALTACALQKDKTLVIASKQFSENILLSEMYAQLVENHTDLEVERRQNMGSTAVCITAMENGEIDLYVEYTGTIYREILSRELMPEMSAQELYDTVKTDMEKEKQITLFRSIGPNNTFALAMPRVKADALGIAAISDLRENASRLVFAANDIFYVRANDGYDTLLAEYGLQFKSAVRMDTESIYDAIGNDQVDVMVVYTTDSMLVKNDMVILEDDKQMFPDYYAVPMIRSSALKAHPELSAVLDLLAGLIDNNRMQELNYLIDIEQKQPAEVAQAFLDELGLLEP